MADDAVSLLNAGFKAVQNLVEECVDGNTNAAEKLAAILSPAEGARAKALALKVKLAKQADEELGPKP